MDQNVQNIDIEEFNYPLPDERIAKFPLEHRDASKLLLYHKGEISESHFSEIVHFLPHEGLLVFNDTKVIQARLHIRKESGASIELFCLEPWQMPVVQAFEKTSTVQWKCLIGNNKRWKSAWLERKMTVRGQDVTLRAERLQAVADAWIVRFSWNGGFSFAEILEAAGEMPLPPYLHRKAEESDRERYQTVYAHFKGSVAAPTAGLHFTEKVFEDLRQAGIEKEFVTLHVGAGTFKPVASQLIGGHEMHTEQWAISKEQVLHFYRHLGKPLIAVGTTSVRTLESLYWYGVQLLRKEAGSCAKEAASGPVGGGEPFPCSGLGNIHISQWYPYEQTRPLPTAAESLECVLEQMEREGWSHLNGETQLMIVPSYAFHLVNGIITNFHQPKSTLLLLVSAFIGEDWKKVYQYALQHEFRFLSYGDSCLFY